MAKAATQKIVVSLSNGVKGVFTGKAIAWPGHCDGITVTDVRFLAPMATGRVVEPTKVDVQGTNQATP